MAEVLTQFAEPVFSADRKPYRAQAVGRALADGIWDAVLNPFLVYEKGEALLRKELGALAAWHLINIIRAYELSDEPESVLSKLRHSALIELIVAGVHEHTFAR